MQNVQLFACAASLIGVLKENEFIQNAQIQVNDDGTFSAVVGDTDVTDVTSYEEVQEALEDYESEQETSEDDAMENQEDTETGDPDAADSDQEEDVYTAEDFLLDLGFEPYSSVSTNAVYTPQQWQINLAENRALGEHYLLYAVRRTYGSSYYWQYYLVRGRDVRKSGDVYTFTDCDLYTYYSYNSTVTYEYAVQSGSINGNSTLVYSDLYFDYVGRNPFANSYPYVSFVLMLVVILLLILGVRRRV